MGTSLRSRQKFSSDAHRKPVDAERMNDEALKRAALVTLRRAICERFLPGTGAAGVAQVGHPCTRCTASASPMKMVRHSGE
jgi:hypothetical protein